MTPDNPPTPTIVERLRYMSEHGLFGAAEAGMLVSHSEAADLIDELTGALRFYATGIGFSEIEDGGKTARDALALLGIEP